MAFDQKRAEQNRKDFPSLTVFDTGEQLEPVPWHQRNGKVDFNNDEMGTDFVVEIHPSKTVDRTAELCIDKLTWDGLMIYVDGKLVATISPEPEI